MGNEALFSTQKRCMMEKNMEHKNLGDKTLMLFIIKRSEFVLIAMIIVAIIIGFSGLLPETLARYVNFTDFFLILFLVLAAAATVGIAYLEYHNYSISVLEKNVKITRGILNRFEIGVPYRRIKRVDIIRTIVCRVLGVSNIVITTVGDEHTEKGSDEIVLPYLEKNLAGKIQHEILGHAQVEQMRMVTAVQAAPETAEKV